VGRLQEKVEVVYEFEGNFKQVVWNTWSDS